jgi:hypothetical protein
MSSLPRLLAISLLLVALPALAAKDSKSKPKPGPEEEADEMGDPEWDRPADEPLATDADEGGEDPPEDLGGDIDSEDPPEDFESRPAARPAARPAEPAPGPSPAASSQGLGVATAGRKPLADNYGARIVAQDTDSLVVELPVLVAQGPKDVAVASWLIAEFHVAGKKVAEARSLVSPSGVAGMGPTLAWLKAQVPANEARGTIEVKVYAAPETGERRPLFTRSLGYAL